MFSGLGAGWLVLLDSVAHSGIRIDECIRLILAACWVPNGIGRKKMSRSISFYIDGFLIIRRAVYPRESDVHLYDNENPDKMRLGQLLALEAAIAGVIWIVILAFIWAIWIMCNWLLVEV